MSSNEIHDNCSKTAEESENQNQKTLEMNFSSIVNIDGNSDVQKSVESNAQIDVQTVVESDARSDNQMNGQMTVSPKMTTVIERVDQTNNDLSSGIDGDSTLCTDGLVIYSSPFKYTRKTSIDVLNKIWSSIETIEWHKSVEELNKTLIKRMFDLFNIKFNDNRIKQIMDFTIEDKLVVIEGSDHRIRYVPNLDPLLFGEVTNDWYCFECHNVRESDGLIDCKTCFRAFHPNCLKNVQKVNLSEEFNCLYCRRLAETDVSLKVNRLEKKDLNKCISFVLNNLQLSFEQQMFDHFSIEATDQNKVLIFKDMDLTAIRHKALTEQYDKLEEAINDFQHFAHNFVISKRDDIKEFKRRFNHEIKELKLCVDCYQYSSDISYDIDDDPHEWFTLVCDPPHELVFAKFGKYPFWPSKVIEIKPGGKQYDVRFFDAPDFSRAIVPINRLRPIEGFQIEDEDNELELPIKLMEKHIHKMREKGVYFMPTVVNGLKKEAKKRRNTNPKDSERPVKRPKKSSEK